MLMLMWARFLKVSKLCYLLAAALIPIGAGNAQSPEYGSPEWRKDEEIGQPLFATQTFRRFSEQPGLCRLEVAVEVMNDMLQFVSDHDQFAASAELEISIIKDNGDQVFRSTKYPKRTVASYEQTNSRREYIVETFCADLPPSKYLVKVHLLDQESQQSRVIERNVELTLPSTRKLVALSDLILAATGDTDESGVPLAPIVNGTIQDKNAVLYCHFDLECLKPNAACQLRLFVIDSKGIRKLEDSLTVLNGWGSTSYSLGFSCQDLLFSLYDVELDAICGGDTVVSRTQFRINYHGLPDAVRNLDQAIRQLKYVASDDEISRLSGAFPSRKEEEFIKFWNSNFPTPGEVMNGKMVEYYDRIEYANQQFSNGREGWVTDRGKVLVLFGKPNEIEHRTVEGETTVFEVWTYSTLNKRFVFEDEYGFGDYRLATPLW